MSAATLHLGDCLDVMREMPEACVDAVVSDPPYGLSFMGKQWDHGVPGVAFWAEALRIAKPGAHIVAFGGTRTHHRLVCAIEDAGWEIRDEIQWLFGSGFPKSHNIGEGRGTALKPACEPICLARKPLIGTVAANVEAHGTGALNIDACRVPADDNTTKAWRGEGDRPRDQYRTGTSGKPVPTDLGRWPANVIHDGSLDVLAAFPEAKGQQGFVGERHGDRDSVNCYGDWGPRPDTPPRADSGSAARFFYCAKATKADRDEGIEGDEQQFVQWQTANGTSGKASSLSEGRDTRRKNIHPTVKPVELMRYLCRLITPDGGIVLDPFMGSGSTGKAAVLDGYRFIGIEKEPQYIEIARARIAWAERERTKQLAMGIQIPLFEALA